MEPEAPTVLLIEMDEITLELYQRELSKSFTVIGLIEMNAVLQTIADRDIGAVVIEPEIGGGRGWDLINAIQTTSPDRDIPIVVCSTREPDGAVPVAEVAKYLTKPVLPRALRENVLQVLKNRARA